LKENIDGEALEWAHRRMMAARGAQDPDGDLRRRAGGRFDAVGEPANYLEKHLRDVIAMVEKRRRWSFWPSASAMT
jgi:cobaltochelatase CobT